MADETEPDESEDSNPVDLTQQEGRWLDQDRPTYAELPDTEEIFDQLSQDELRDLRDQIDERLEDES